MELYNFLNEMMTARTELLILKQDRNIIIKILYLIDKRFYNQRVYRLLKFIADTDITYSLLKNFSNYILSKFDDSIYNIFYDASILRTIVFKNQNIEITLIDNPFKHNIRVKHTVENNEDGNTVIVKKEFKDVIEYSKDKLYIDQLNDILKTEICNYIRKNCLL